MSDPVGYLEKLIITQGAGVGRPMQLLHWQRRLLYLLRTPGDVAVTMARGNGKSTFCAALACCYVDGPLRQPRGEVLVVASSFQQARVVFDHATNFIGQERLQDRSTWRLWDSQNIARILHVPSGASLRVLAADPRRMHGTAPQLAILDEPAQWVHTQSDRALAAIRTGMGKIPGSRLVAVGTRPAEPSHWFGRMLKGPRSIVYAARPDDPPFQRRTWLRANPSAAIMPALEERIRLEAEEARRDPASLAQFSALRLNLGVADVIEAVLLEPGIWKRAQGNADRAGGYVLGLDLGATAAMSAACGYWPETGRLEGVAVFGSQPDLRSRGLADGVGNLYQKCHDRGELLTSPGRVSDVRVLLDVVWERWGRPSAIVCDRWRDGDLRDALAALRWPRMALVLRGQGYKDGGEDVRDFRRAFLTGDVVPVPSLLLTAAMSEARTISDPSGNAKLAKSTQGGRRASARDDAAAAAILAVSLGARRYRKATEGPGLRSAIV